MNIRITDSPINDIRALLTDAARFIALALELRSLNCCKDILSISKNYHYEDVTKKAPNDYLDGYSILWTPEDRPDTPGRADILRSLRISYICWCK